MTGVGQCPGLFFWDELTVKLRLGDLPISSSVGRRVPAVRRRGRSLLSCNCSADSLVYSQGGHQVANQVTVLLRGRREVAL